MQWYDCLPPSAITTETRGGGWCVLLDLEAKRYKGKCEMEEELTGKSPEARRGGHCRGKEAEGFGVAPDLALLEHWYHIAPRAASRLRGCSQTRQHR